jgi:hypothetical protein
MWRDNHSNDYKFFDRRISEEFTIGGTGILLHKYLGPQTNTAATAYSLTSDAVTGTNSLSFANVSLIEVGQTIQGINIDTNTTITKINVAANTATISSSLTGNIAGGTPVNVYWNDATKPNYTTDSVLNIQDLLFLENRDRKYDTSVYALRGIYTVSDNDWDLTQFGLMLSTDTIVLTFHLNDTVASIGRKLMSGDVIELQHKKDYFPLNDDLPAALKRFYVIQDVTFAAEGFSQTWWPHLIRIKAKPMVNSQEYKDILNSITTVGTPTGTPIGQVMSNLAKLGEINDAVLAQAEIDVPVSGTDINSIYNVALDPNGLPGDPTGSSLKNLSVNSTNKLARATTPDANIPAYLGGDGLAPDGYPVVQSTSFPTNPKIGDFVLRTDFVPNRLFRFDGARWNKIEDSVRTNTTPGPANATQHGRFYNDNSTFTDLEGQTQPTRQSLSKALKPKADN